MRDHQGKDRDHLLSQGHPQLGGGREAALLVQLEMGTACSVDSPFSLMFISFFKQILLERLAVGSKGSGIFLTFYFPRAIHLPLSFSLQA